MARPPPLRHPSFFVGRPFYERNSNAHTPTPETQASDIQSPETRSLAKQRSLADRILAYSVVGSVFINIGWLLWVGNSDLFGGAASLSDLKPQLIKIVKPPIPQKPKPKKKEPPPPPPKHQPPPPKQRPLKPPPPRPHPTPPGRSGRPRRSTGWPWRRRTTRTR